MSRSKGNITALFSRKSPSNVRGCTSMTITEQSFQGHERPQERRRGDISTSYHWAPTLTRLFKLLLLATGWKSSSTQSQQTKESFWGLLSLIIAHYFFFNQLKYKIEFLKKPKCKAGYNKTLRRKHRQSLWNKSQQCLFGSTSYSNGNKNKNKQMGPN